MISQQSPFLDIIKEENLSKIKIDKELVPYFINVMKKFQEVFDKKGYTEAKNFAARFEENLIGIGNHNYGIHFKNLEENTLGQHYRKERKVFVSDKYLQEDKIKKVESTLSHELLHFLSLSAKPYKLDSYGQYVQDYSFIPDFEVWGGGFVNEGLTEMLNQQIYPDSNAYKPQVAMTKLLLFVNNSKENLFAYFNGRVPGLDYINKNYKNFLDYANLYQEQNEKNAYSMLKAVEDENFKKAYDCLIAIFEEKVSVEIEKFEFLTLKDFVDRVKNFEDYVFMPTQKTKTMVQNLTAKFIDFYFTSISQNKKEELKVKILDLMKKELLIEKNLVASKTLETPQFNYEMQTTQSGDTNVIVKDKNNIKLVTYVYPKNKIEVFNFFTDEDTMMLLSGFHYKDFYFSAKSMNFSNNNNMEYSDVLERVAKTGKNQKDILKQIKSFYKAYDNFVKDKLDLNLLLQDKMVKQVYALEYKAKKIDGKLYLTKHKNDDMKLKLIKNKNISLVAESNYYNKGWNLDVEANILSYQSPEKNLTFEAKKIYETSENVLNHDMAKVYYNLNHEEDVFER